MKEGAQVNAGVANTMLAAEIDDRDPGLVLLQNSDDLFFRKPYALHALVLVLGQSELQTGLSPRGKVNPIRMAHAKRAISKKTKTANIRRYSRL
jgi:hypothetical protein